MGDRQRSQLGAIAQTEFLINVVLRGGRPPGSLTIADRSLRRKMAVECARAYPKCVAFWNKVLDDEKATVAERMMASDRLMDRAFGKVPQPVHGAMDQRTHKILEVRWMPPDPPKISSASSNSLA